MAGETKPAQWFHGRGSVRKGPYPAAELSQLIATGAVLPTDLVWRAGFIDWAVVSSVAELNTPPSPPPSETKLVQWFYGRNGVQKGPFTPSEMAAMATAGTVLPTDLVWRHGFGEWLPASSVTELMGPRAVPASLPDGPHWYYGRDSARQGPFSETQMRDLAAAGTLTEMDWVWREGLPEWAAARRFPELFSAQSTIQPAGQAIGPYQDLQPLTLWLQRLMYVYAVSLCALVIWRGIDYLTIWQTQTALTDAAAVQALVTKLDAFKSITDLVIVFLFWGTLIMFFMWIYRAGTNARQLGAKEMTISPGWAIGWCFVPVAQIWMPFRAMSEIWRASEDPSNWQKRRSSTILGWWWVCTLAQWVSLTPNKFGMKFGNSGFPEVQPPLSAGDALFQIGVAIFKVGFALAASLLLIIIVQRIYQFQAAEWARQHLAALPPP